MMECPKLSEKDIKVESQYDTGGFSDIYRGRWVDKTRTQELAIKIFRKERNTEPEVMKAMKRRLKTEVRTWLSAQPHDNILAFFGLYVGKPATFPALVSPLRPAGNILNFLRTSHPNRRLLAVGIANGLAHLHLHNIIHGDLTPKNVLIHIDGTGQPIPEISDFGRAKVQGAKGFQASLHTTPRYAAPEILLNSLPSPENSIVLLSPPKGAKAANWVLTKFSDVYSLGMVILHVVSGRKPYYEWNEAQISVAFFTKESEEPKLSDHERFHPVEWIWPLLRRCWGFGQPPKERCMAYECFQDLSKLHDPDEDIISEPDDIEDISLTELFELEEAQGVNQNVSQN